MALRLGLLWTLLWGWLPAAGAAELVVISSSDPSLEKGAIIDGARPLEVAAGATVVLVSSSGNTIKLTGPYSAAPDTSAPGADNRLVDSLSRLISREARAPSTLAVFRSMLGRAPSDRPDIWGVHIARAGKYCLRPDRQATLWWAAARPGAAVTMSTAGERSGGVRIKWPRGKRHLPWPRELELRDGATYVARFWSGDSGEQLVVAKMPALETDAHRAAWMAEHGCTRQALSVLQALGSEEP